MKVNKKILLIVSIIAISILVSITIVVVIKNNNKEKPEEILKQYISYISQKNYESMYDNVSIETEQKISKEDFIKRNKNIYEGIELNNIIIEIGNIEKSKQESNKTIITYNITMDTVAGQISFENKSTFLNENKKYKLNWSSNDIFPKLNDDDKVKVKTLTAKRGNILDRNDTLLAGEGVASSIGLVPEKMNENTQEDIQKISELLEVSLENINKLLNASYVKEDTFVPIKTVAKTEQELKDKLLQIKGIKITDTKTRIYPLAEKTSHLIGYVQNISAEELEKLKSQGYSQNSIIGKSAIEKEYEEKLRGIDGCQITITDSKSNEKQTLAKKELKNGENVKLTIDSTLQTKLYNQFLNDKSCSVAMNSKTGEILALVSTPTFNSNDFTMGMSTNKWNALNNDEKKPLINRYTKTWAPGSSFKPVVAAIGITTNTLNPEENYGRSGLSWQKDSSWGAYKVTTLKEYVEQVNLKNALINSDNIYFAKTAINIGKEKLSEQLLKIGFDENIQFEQDISKSQFADDNKISSEIQLADTGYGQGKVLVNPIHMASIYSAFVNEGNMIKPYIEYSENKKVEYLKEQAFSKEAAKIITEDLIQVVESPQGTAHSVKINGKTIAGKTGTAEIKNSKDDKEGTELGWFNAFNIDEKNPLLVISMVEDVKNKGGSHYLLPKIKTIFE